MAREILFRAKRIDNGEWVEGYYAVVGKRHVIIKAQAEDYYSVENNLKKSHGNEVIEVDPDTVCQYTEKIDRDGKLIFVNSIVIAKARGCIGVVKFGEHEKGYGYYINWISKDAKSFREDFLYWQEEVFLNVIGNIFDNPELLKEDGDE